MLARNIIETSIKLFLSNGIKSVSMDDVAHEVGISKRTLYEHFSSKDTLLVACLEVMQDRRMESAKRVLDSSDSFIDIVMTQIYEAMSFTQSVNPEFFSDLSKLKYHGAKEKFDKGIEENRRRIIALMEKGKAEGYIREDIDTELITMVMVGNHDNSHLRQCSATGKWTPTYIMSQMALIFIRGISTAKGVELIESYAEKMQQQLQDK